MTMMEVSAKTKDGDKITVKYDPGDNLQDMIAKSSVDGADGESIIFSEARAARIIKIQDIVRNGSKAEKSAKDIQAEVNKFNPSLKKRGRTKAEKLREEFGQLTAEDKKALLSELTG